MLEPCEALRVARLVAGGDLTQREIARRTGVGRSTVGRIFRGERQVELFPDPDPLAEFARTLTPAQFARYKLVRARRIAREARDENT